MCFYIASLNNDMFRPPYWPSSGCTFSYFEANYTIYNVFVNEISSTSVKSAFAIITVAEELKVISDINSIKSWVCDLGRGEVGVMVSNRVYSLTEVFPYPD